MKEKIKQTFSFCKMHKKAVIVSEIIIGLGLFLIIYMILGNRNWKADKILNEMMNINPDITVSETTSQELALDHVQSVAYFNDTLIKNETFAGFIEVFENQQYALLRKEYLENLYSETSLLVSVDDFGKDMLQKYGVTKPYLYVNGNVLLRLDGAYSSYQATQLSKLFHSVLEKNHQTEVNIPEKQVIETTRKNNVERAKTEALKYRDDLILMLDEELMALENQIEEAAIDELLDIIEKATPYKEVKALYEKANNVSQQAEDKIKAMAQKVDEALDAAENALTQSLLDDAKKIMEELTHQVFDSYKEGWNERVSHIQWAINDKIIREYKDKCEAYDYDDLMAETDSYIDAYVYFRGKVVEVTKSNNTTVLRVNVTPVYALFTDTILYWEDSVYVELANDLNMNIQKDQLVELWGQVKGTTTYNTTFGGSQTILKYYGRYADVN